MATSRRGRIVKIIHQGLKHYAVVKDKVATGLYSVSFPEHKDGCVFIATIELPVDEIRLVSFTQDHPVSVMLRQLCGIALSEKVKQAKLPQVAQGKISKPEQAQPAIPSGKPTAEQIDNFTVKGVAIKDMPEGTTKAIAIGIAKSMIPSGINSIDFM